MRSPEFKKTKTRDALYAVNNYAWRKRVRTEHQRLLPTVMMVRDALDTEVDEQRPALFKALHDDLTSSNNSENCYDEFIALVMLIDFFECAKGKSKINIAKVEGNDHFKKLITQLSYETLDDLIHKNGYEMDKKFAVSIIKEIRNRDLESYGLCTLQDVEDEVKLTTYTLDVTYVEHKRANIQVKAKSAAEALTTLEDHDLMCNLLEDADADYVEIGECIHGELVNN